MKNISKKSTRRSTPTVVESTIQERIVSLLNRREGEWSGTMTDLNRAITSGRKTTPENWPSSPSVLRRVVNRVVPRLRRLGVSVRFGRTSDHMRTRFVEFYFTNR
jgi:hypothetical protein